MKSKLIFLGIFFLTALILPTSIAADESYSEDGFLVLGQDDLVGITFWIATAAMLASSIFFLIERANVAPLIKMFFRVDYSHQTSPNQDI